MHIADPRFKTWLLHETGIDSSALGANVLERAVRERMRIAHGSSASALGNHFGVDGETDPAVTERSLDVYWDLLNTSADERQALIELLVVPETWFFRDRDAFVALAKLAFERLMREPARVLRILSAPCASGEEPYSISMTLLDAGIGATRFVIDAVDISAHAIEFAQRAIYGRNSFRGNALDFRERHFSEIAGRWHVNDAVRTPVRFIHANLLDAPPRSDIRYDFIFCRNVLIYFHRDVQDRAIQLLETRLAEGGTIFVGPAETGLMMRHAMTSARIPMAFAFQRTPPGATVPPSDDPHAHFRSLPPEGAAASLGAARREAPRTIQTQAVATAAAPAPPTRATPAALDEARSLADAGRFDEAERLAHAVTLMHGPNAAVFYLLGLIADARGRSAEASAFYRKTLYLEPTHYEALAHLAVLLDGAGDRTASRHLMSRAERVMMKGGETAGGAREGGTHGPRRS